MAPGLSLQARPGRGGAAHRGAGSISEEANLNLGWLGFCILEGTSVGPLHGEEGLVVAY